ncbi:MAG: amidohydrolase family protein [Gemmatimonadaceae bacterium]
MPKYALALCLVAVSCSPHSSTSSRLPPSASRTIEIRNGQWFDGTRFVDRTMYSVDGFFAENKPPRVDTVIDLQHGYVVPPFAEAHNHNVDATTAAAARVVVDKYFRDGVFYVQNPANVLRARSGLVGFINVPTGIDATFANAALTGPGGHPMGLFLRNLGRGAMVATDSNSTSGFLWTIADRGDLDRKWPQILASHPDFIKTMLLYSEEYERRKSDSAFFNWRGLNPALLPEIVRRAHAAGLRVMTHIETAADFRNAVIAGVDQIGHTPGFRGNAKTQLPDFAPFLMTDADAELAAKRGVFVITTLSGPDGLPDTGLLARFIKLDSLNLAMMKKHHVKVIVGSDSYRTTSVPEAMWLSKLGVLTNAELLRAWTDETAHAIFPQRKIGKLARGYEASLLVLAGDPIADFSNVRRIVLRMKQGQLIQVAATP